MTNSNLYKLKLVIGREFNTRVRKKTFLVTTFIVPIVLLLVWVGVALFFVYSGSLTNNETIGVIDENGKYMKYLEDNNGYHFVRAKENLEYYKNKGKDKSSKLSAILEIKGDLIKNPNAIAFYSFREVSPDMVDYIKKSLDEGLTNEHISQSDIPNIKSIMDSLQVSVRIPTYLLTSDGREKRGVGEMASIVSQVFVFIIYFFLSLYGAMVMFSILEEKKNRIIEVIVSSVRPVDLMLGKIVGIGLVGLFQMILWGIFLFICIMVGSFFFIGSIDFSQLGTIQQDALSGGIGMNMSASDFSSLQSEYLNFKNINWLNILSMFVLYFCGGYLLYASLYAVIGATMSEEGDGGMFSGFISFFLLIAFLGGFAAAKSPNSAIAVWTSMIPFTSPISMLVRVAYKVSWWQQAISILILYGSAFLLLLLASKIYRIGILMYGKKNSLKEVARWFFYK